MDSFGARFGLLVKSKRGLHGFTQESLALQVFGSIRRKTHISRLENGRIPNPQAGTVDELVTALHISREELEACRTPPELPPLLLENLAMRFGHDNPDAPPAMLAEFLTAKAREFREMQGRLKTLVEADGRIANLVGAAEAALAAGDFDEADARLADAEEMQQTEHTLVHVRKQAKLRVERGSAALLKGEALAAGDHFEAASAYFYPFDVNEGAVGRNKLGIQLYEYGIRFGPNALLAAVKLYRSNLDCWARSSYPLEWAATQSNLGAALSKLGAQQSGAEAISKLDEAIAACRAALEVRNLESHPLEWADTQINLGSALDEKGVRVKRQRGVPILEDAVEAYQAALQVLTCKNNPDAWVSAKICLGNSLRNLAKLNNKSQSGNLLRRAIVELNEVLEIRTKSSHPREWAMVQGNLCFAYIMLGEVSGRDATAQYRLALASSESALEVFNQHTAPLDYVKAMQLRAAVLRRLDATSE